MKNSLWTKGLVIGIILLFIEASVLPIISAYNMNPEIINRNMNITQNYESERNTGIETASFDPSRNISGGLITIGFHYINISENHVFGIDVGDNGATVKIYVNYTMSCGGVWDTGSCDISFVGGGDSDSAGTSGDLNDTLVIEKFFSPGQNFSVRLHAYYYDWWLTGSLTINETRYSNFSTNAPPGPPLINGPTSGNIGEIYTYTFVAIDPDGDNIFYEITWGDGGVEDWYGPCTSNEITTRSHQWTEEGTYNISARAKDVYDHIGEWRTISVTMPLNVSSQQSTQIVLLRLIKNNALK